MNNAVYRFNRNVDTTVRALGFAIEAEKPDLEESYENDQDFNAHKAVGDFLEDIDYGTLVGIVTRIKQHSRDNRYLFSSVIDCVLKDAINQELDERDRQHAAERAAKAAECKG